MGTTAPGPQDGPKRLLSIDGGGLLGLIPAEALVEIEKQLDAITGHPAPLCERFDLIGGTSTGAILAAGLSLGLKAADLRDFYLKFGKEIFTKSFFLTRLWHMYPSGPLEQHLKDVFGENTTLGSPKLKTCIMIVTKNATQGSTWFFTNNKDSKFFSSNADLPLWQVVRASTAAPTFFPPQPMAIPDANKNPQNFEFVDGGVSTYNNPSLQVFLEATDLNYGYKWLTGPDKLLLMSLGTGFNTVKIAAGAAAKFNVLNWARYIIKELMGDANLQQNVLMHLIGQKPQGAISPAAAVAAVPGAPSITSLDALSAATGKFLTYQRITVELTRKRLDGFGLTDIDPDKVGEMDAADQIANMQRIGQAVAREQVKMGNLKSFFM